MNVDYALALGIILFSFPAIIIMDKQAECRVIEANGAFSNRLYQELAKNEGNVLFSPISAHSCLAMAYQGAKDETAQAISSALGVPDAELAANGYSEIMNRLNKPSIVTFLMLNKIFLMEGNVLLQKFESVLTDQFRSKVQLLNFAENDVAADAINICVEENTGNKIKDLIRKDELDALTRLVFVNAIYFKGDWANRFEKESTRTEPFYSNDFDRVDVQMMHREGKFPYKFDEGLDAQVLEMPYANRNLSMIVILPKQRNEIDKLEEKLVNIDLTKITEGMVATNIDLAMPKFRIERRIDLKSALIRLGLELIFDKGKANFSGMVELQHSKKLFVSKVIQKASIEVDENRAEAIGTTFIEIATPKKNFRTESVPTPIPMFVDHPFVFAITENGIGQPNKNIIFMGRMNQL